MASRVYSVFEDVTPVAGIPDGRGNIDRGAKYVTIQTGLRKDAARKLVAELALISPGRKFHFGKG